MLNRFLVNRQLQLVGFGLVMALVVPAVADRPAPAHPHPSGSTQSARPLPSAARERLQRLKERRLERLKERQEQRERIRQLSEDFERSLTRSDAKTLREQQEQLFSLRTERRREHRVALRRRFGAAVGEPAVRAELELHARRLARLKRMQFVAATDHTGKKRAALLARAEKLVASENARHERAMQRLVPSQNAGPAGAASVTTIPSAPSAPSGGKP